MVSQPAVASPRLFQGIARFLALKAWPDALPRHIGFAVALAVAAIVLPELMFPAEAFDLRILASSSAIAAFFLFAVPWLLARSTGHADRYAQSLAGLALADLALLPFAGLFLRLADDAASDFGAWGIPLLLVAVALMVWMLALRTRIWMFVTGEGAVRSGVLAIMLFGFEMWAQALVQ